jgi:protein TonB
MRGEVGQNRRLRFALLASLALHAVVFLAVSERRHPARPAEFSPGPIEARLAEPPPPATEPEASRPVPQKKSAPAATPQTRPAASPEASVAIPEPPSAAVEAATAPQPPVTRTEAAPPAAQPGTAAADPGTLGQYRLQLIAAARRYKRYPPLARENNWEGNVVVGVAIAASGAAEVKIKNSSGYQILDRQALEMFGQATQAVPVPPALRGKEFAFEVRAVYGIQD